MKKTKLKVISIVMVGVLSITLGLTSKSSMVFAAEKQGVSNLDKAAILQNLESAIKDGDKFSTVKQLDVSKENAPLTKEGNPEERVRVIVELNDRPATLKLDDGLQPSEDEIQMVKDSQAPIQEEVVEKTGEEIRHTYGNLINGFSMDIKRKDIEKIKSVDGVVSVREANVYYPDMTTAKELTQALDVWKDYGYKGEGMVISVVDTGIDYTHKDMRLTDISKAKLNKDNTNKGIGKFYTDKVPYGYNFADENDEVIDIAGSMHGMHVAGIVSANATQAEVDESKGIQGVAPEAQVLAMKVFSNNQDIVGAYSDDIIAAIESSVELQANVINMSLGSVAGYRDAEDPEQIAIKRATDDGVICVVSAGNSATSLNPYIIEGMSDIATVGAPGLAADALQVASYENSQVTLPALKMLLDGKETLMGYTECDVNPLDVYKNGQELELVNCGLGQVSDFEGKDLTGKIALVNRGVINFVDKQLNAQAAGASGVIIYNNVPNVYINMATDSSMKIPALFITKEDGINLLSNISKGVKVTFGDDVKNAANPLSAKMSDFSSWGPAPNLEFAPQITGPGGNIYSTLNNDRYGNMSGTSMSSPHVAGATALIIEGLKAKGINLQGRDLVEFVKKSIINTAEVLEETNPVGEKIPYSPRRQGSGMIQTKDAINNRVLAVGEDNQATISLKEIGDTTNFNITLTNYSNKDEKYTVSTNGGVLTAFTPSMIGEPDLYGYMDFDTALEGATVDFDKNEVLVPANGKVTVKATLNVKKDTVVDNFIEGFINFTAIDTNTPSLVVPYMGYYGDWGKQTILDGAVWDESSVNLVGSFAATKILGDYDYLGFDGKDAQGQVIINSEKIAISPNADELGDGFIPALYTLRNAKSVKVDLLDKDKKVIAKDINGEEELRKKVLASTDGWDASIYSSLAWDGSIYNSKTGENDVVPEGQYYLNYKARVDGSDKYQDLIMPVKVDVTPTKVNLVSDKTSDKADYKLSLDFNNEYKNGLVNELLLYVNGEEVKTFTVNDDILTADLKLNDNEINKIEVVTLDNAYNIGYNEFDVAVGNVKTEAKLVDFPLSQTLTNNQLTVNGEYSGLIEEILINGEKPDAMENGKFTKLITLKEGSNTITLLATDINGKIVTNYGYKVSCDTQAPILNITELILNSSGMLITSKDEIIVKGNVCDNGDGYKLFLNGENKLNVSESGANPLVDTYRDFSYNVPVKDGDLILLKAIDAVGHETIKQFNVKVDKTIPEINISGIEDGKSYNTNVKPIINVNPESAKLDIKLNGVEYNGEELTNEGNYELVAHAVGVNGIENNITVNFSIDKTAPTLIVSDVEDGKAYNKNVTPKYSSEDGANIVTTLNDEIYNGEEIINEGTYVLKIKAIDKAGNITEKNITFVIDKTAPVITDGIINGMKYDKEVKAEIKSNEEAQITTTLNDKLYNGEVIKTDGNYTLKVVAIDKAGNKTEVVKVFTIKLPEKPVNKPNPTPQPTPNPTPNPGGGDKVTDEDTNNRNTNNIIDLNKNDDGKGDLPKTGGKNPIYLGIIALLVIGVGILFVIKKKDKKVK